MNENQRLEFGTLLLNESEQISFFCQRCHIEFLSFGQFVRHQTDAHGAVQRQSSQQKMPDVAIPSRSLHSSVAHEAISSQQLHPSVAHGGVEWQPLQQNEITQRQKNHPLEVISRSDAATTQTTSPKKTSPIPTYGSTSVESTPAKFKCKECRKDFDSFRRLDFHRDICKPMPKINCDYCSKKCRTTVGLRIHIHRRHKTDIAFVCDACPKSFNLPSELTLHRRNHHGMELNVRCNFCGECFATKYERATHVKHDHPYDRYRCSRCSFTSKVIGVVRRHQSIVHPS